MLGLSPRDARARPQRIRRDAEARCSIATNSFQSYTYDDATLREVSSKNTIGVTISDKATETRMPPVTAMANGCSICEPEPSASASGSMPHIAATAVITIGRNLR